MRSLRIIVTAVAIAAALTATLRAGSDMPAPKAFSHAPAAEQRAAEAWADSVMSRLTPLERLEQLMVPRLDLKGDAAGRAAMRRTVTKHHVGGILLGKGSIADYVTLINEAQAASKVPLMVTLDGEWGLAMRVSDAPRYPYNMALGAIRDPRLLYDYGREVGRECRAAGINVDFAPVLDVNSNPANPVIGMRSFGENPARVAELGVAFSRGMESAGVLSVAKHFPGHGNTATDSHKALPRIDGKRKQLEKTDLPPFRKYIDAKLGGVMVGHLNVPALDGSGTAASLSHKITTDLLKKQLHFGGLVFTDALAMKGAGAKRNNCLEAFEAGADMLLQPMNLDTDIKALTDAIAKGRIKQAEVDARCRKVLIYKYLMGLSHFKPSTPEAVKRLVCSPEAESTMQRLADAAVTVLRNDAGLLPLGDLGHRRIAVLLVGEKADCDFARYCARYAPVEVVTVNGSAISGKQMEVLRQSDVVVAAYFTDAAWARTTFGNVRRLANVANLFFVNPYKIKDFGGVADAATLVALYQNLPSLQRAGAMAVFGGIAVDGRFSGGIEGVAAEGDGLKLPKVRLSFSSPAAAGMAPDLGLRIDSIVNTAIAAGAMPGCQVLVARDGEVVVDRAYGRIDTGADAPAVTTETLFDLASVTKTHATLAGLMKAVDEGLVELDDRVGYHIAALDSTDKGDISVRELLFHESGMPPVINVYRLAFDPMTYEGALIKATDKAPYTIKISGNDYGNSQARLRNDIYAPREDEMFAWPVARDLFVSQEGIDCLMDAVHSAPLRSKSYAYSCLNFILLKELQEAATGVDLDQWIDTEIYGPLGAWHTAYLPLQRFDASQIAATENDRFLRRQKLHGYVHDEMAAFSGGIQGNAGLFANAEDVAKLCQMWLDGGTYGGERILSEKTVRTFTRTHSRSGRRGLGFDMLSANIPKGVDKASDKAFGHTGFTGTCYWVDPDSRLIIVFLSNRVDPSRDNPVWNRLSPRGAVVRAVYDAL